MSDKSESKRLWRTAAIVAGVGVFVIAGLIVLFVRMSNDAYQRKLILSNEANTIYTLDLIAAAEHLYLQNVGEYGTLQQLVDSGIMQATFDGDPPATHGYTFTLRRSPRTDTQTPTYSINADPVRASGRDATGRLHFFGSSEVTGIRVNEERPATATDKPRLSTEGY